MSETPANDSYRELLTRLFDSLILRTDQGDYEAVRNAFQDVHDVFTEMLARYFAPALNEYLSGADVSSIQKKQSLASRVNEDLRNLGLAVKCPLTGSPASLVGQNTNNVGDGRFRMEALGRGPKRLTMTTKKLPYLELVKRPPKHDRHPGRGGDSGSERER